MNDFSELERELRKLRPVAAPAEMMARIESALAELPGSTPTSAVLSRRNPFRVNWLPLGLGLAAAAAFMLLAKVGQDDAPKNSQKVVSQTPLPSRAARAGTGKFVPAGLTQVVFNTRDEGLVFPNGAESPVRRLRYQTQETLQWRQPETGASLRVSYPSEEVVMMPVSGQ